MTAPTTKRGPRKAETYRSARRNQILRSDLTSQSFGALRMAHPAAPRQQLRALLWPAPKRKVRPYLCKPDSVRVLRDRLGKPITTPDGKQQFYLHRRKQPRVYPYHGPVRSKRWRSQERIGKLKRLVGAAA
jgi:hypothetical protein